MNVLLASLLVVKSVLTTLARENVVTRFLTKKFVKKAKAPYVLC